MVQLTQGLRQLRDATSDTHDSVHALKEAQVRAEQEHGRLEGESQQHQEGLGGRRRRQGGLNTWGPRVSGN